MAPHTIFPRPLGSRISSVNLCSTGIADDRRDAHQSHSANHEPLQPLDLLELPGEGERCKQLFESGLVKLPMSITNAKDFKSCGAAFRQYLDLHFYWQSLTKQFPGLVPFSLRYGFAWRGGKYYNRSMPVRDLALLMGHDVKTHQKHYGQWTTDEDTKESVLRAVGTLMGAA